MHVDPHGMSLGTACGAQVAREGEHWTHLCSNRSHGEASGFQNHRCSPLVIGIILTVLGCGHEESDIVVSLCVIQRRVCIVRVFAGCPPSAQRGRNGDRCLNTSQNAASNPETEASIAVTIETCAHDATVESRVRGHFQQGRHSVALDPTARSTRDMSSTVVMHTLIENSRSAVRISTDCPRRHESHLAAAL